MVNEDRPTCRCPCVLSCWLLCPPRTPQFGRARFRPYPLLRNTVGQICISTSFEALYSQNWLTALPGLFACLWVLRQFPSFQEKNPIFNVYILQRVQVCRIWTGWSGRRKIRLIESNAKCRHLKKLTCKATLRQVFICLRPPTLLSFCLGWCSNFVSSESVHCQIQSVKLIQNMVSNRAQHPHALPVTHCLYIMYCTVPYLDTGKGGGRGEANQWEG